jgi:hypothetical protein
MKRSLEDLERELRERAHARNAGLVVDTDRHGRFRAAFKQDVNPTAPSDSVILLAATATHKRVALESLLTADAQRPSES